MEHKIVNCPHCGKIISNNILNGNYVRPAVTCPECGGEHSFKRLAEVFTNQYWGQIVESVCEQMKELATAKSARDQKRVYYGLIDGQDTMRIIKAYSDCFSQNKETD
jgi:transcription elongation factor Elf1